MPYAPGVTDIRGQLIAQGIGSAGNSIADSIVKFQEKRDKDAADMAAAKTTLSFVKQNSKTLGISSGELDQLDALTKNPKVPAAAAAQAAHSMIANSVLRQKAQESQQQQAAQTFALQQAQDKKARDDAQLAHLRQLDAFSRSQNQAQVGTDPNSVRMNTELYGTAGGPMDVEAGSSPTMTSQALDYFRATGRNLEPAEAGQFINAGYREDNARTRAEAAQQIADARNQTRTDIENAKREVDQAKLDAKGNIAWHTSPDGQHTIAVVNGQPVVIKSPEPKDAMDAMIERMQKDGELTKEEAVAERKKLLKHRQEFSPTPWNAFNGTQAAGNYPQPMAPQNQPPPQPAPAPVRAQGGPPQISTQAQYDALPPGAQYIGPDGKLAVKKSPAASVAEPAGGS